MRRTVFALSFDRELEDIAIYIDERFGQAARWAFVEEVKAICALLASYPGLGKFGNQNAPRLIGFSYKQNWIYFEADADEARFVHIVSSKQDLKRIQF